MIILGAEILRVIFFFKQLTKLFYHLASQVSALRFKVYHFSVVTHKLVLFCHLSEISWLFKSRTQGCLLLSSQTQALGLYAF